MSAQSADHLQLRALQQRDRIHHTALELISKVDHAKEKLSLSYNVRQHFAAAASVVAGIALLSGYALGTSFGKR